MFKFASVFFLFLAIYGYSKGNERELLIVSCGAGGTHYTVQCLNRGGLAVAHEGDGPYGSVSWPYTVGPYNWAGAVIYTPTFKHVFHQVRDPLKVISSWANHCAYPGAEDRVDLAFIRREIPEIKQEDPMLIQCAKYWYYWNLRAEETAEWRYRVESLLEVADEFEERLGVQLDKEAMSLVSKSTGHWTAVGSHPMGTLKITWQYLKEHLPLDLYENIQKMAANYGYSTVDRPEESFLKIQFPM